MRVLPVLCVMGLLTTTAFAAPAPMTQDSGRGEDVHSSQSLVASAIFFHRKRSMSAVYSRRCSSRTGWELLLQGMGQYILGAVSIHPLRPASIPSLSWQQPPSHGSSSPKRQIGFRIHNTSPP